MAIPTIIAVIVLIAMLSIIFILNYFVRFLSLLDMINLLLTSIIALFAILQGMIMYVEYVLRRESNKLESAKKDLETTYAPLFTLLNGYSRTEKEGIRITEDQKWNLDLIFATYSLPVAIKEYWKTKIQKMKTTTSFQVVNQTKYPVQTYLIPNEFKDMINAEYEKRIKEYNNLLTGNTFLQRS